MQNYPPDRPTYPPQGPPYYAPPPPMTGPPRRRRRWPWILLAIFIVLVALVVYAGQGSNSQTSTTPATTQVPAGNTLVTQALATTPTPAHALTWMTVQTFKGNGEKKTPIFTVPDDWKIVYTCTGLGSGIDGFLAVTVYGSDNSLIDLAVNATCKNGVVTKDETEEHQAGSIYLDINGTGDWTVTVQELK